MVDTLEDGPLKKMVLTLRDQAVSQLKDVKGSEKVGDSPSDPPAGCPYVFLLLDFLSSTEDSWRIPILSCLSFTLLSKLEVLLVCAEIQIRLRPRQAKHSKTILPCLSSLFESFFSSPPPLQILKILAVLGDGNSQASTETPSAAQAAPSDVSVASPAQDTGVVPPASATVVPPPNAQAATGTTSMDATV
jgi:hypothetical protein